MAETFALSELVIPGTYVQVRAEGLISAGGISSGNIGIVGTARKMIQQVDDEGDPVVDGEGDPVMIVDAGIYGVTHVFSDYASAQEALGVYDANSTAQFNLMRAMEVLFRNGARTVYARALNLGASDAQPGPADYTTQFNELVKEDVNILVAPQLSTANALLVLPPLLETGENSGKDMMAVIGCDGADVAAMTGQVTADKRLIMTAPGFEAYDAAAKAFVVLGGTYSAAAVAGLISTLTPHTSPTNKKLVGVTKLATKFSYSNKKDLINGGVLALEDRLGIRVLRGITTEMASNGPFKQVTTRRITDFAKAGVRQVSNPFIGRLNNQRVRKALQGAIDGFLATMVQDEALTEYSLEVTATRADEIAGRAIVNVVLKPTFSIDFIAVTLVLQ